ncbi:PPP family 3-phenylpropionic acid transporter [Paucimonas lemoignei]|uniref:PPP family 3-phenylpropionic acid transporter n=1 Tax=Paucimonas lemoignei TaxID=29443 RepID=A0A4R3I1L2_PAULE|nr:MFS transporter [Paucimonas lemoignei]TCS39627.1 PPP family 3-phenylpropionic acid transporter [Paucimonas lemoignei]
MNPRPQQSLQFSLFFFAYYGYIGVFSPYATLYFADRGLTAPQIALLMSLMQVLRIFGPAAWGWIADHTQKRARVLQVASLVSALLFCSLFFGSGFTYLLLVMLAVSTFTSALAPVSEALIVGEMKGDLTHYGRMRLWGSVGFIVAVSCAGYLLDWSGIGMFPWVGLVLLAAVFGVSLRLRESAPVVSHAGVASIKQILRRREVQAFFASAFLMLAAHAALYVFYSLYLERLGYGTGVIGMMWALGVVAEIVFFYFQAPAFARFGVQNLMLASLLLAALRFGLIAGLAESLIVLVVAQILHAATFGIHHAAAVATLQCWFAGPLQARGQALYTSVSYGLGGSLGGLLLGFCWERFGAASVYWIAAMFAIGGAVCAKFSYSWMANDEVSRCRSVSGNPL